MIAKEIKEAQVLYDFICEGCGAQGLLASPNERYDFNCPEGCGARYIQWRPSPNEPWRLTCVVCPVLASEMASANAASSASAKVGCQVSGSRVMNEDLGDVGREDEDDPDDLGDNLELEFDCHMLADGTCLAAGSEMCDWECPYGRGYLTPDT